MSRGYGRGATSLVALGAILTFSPPPAPAQAVGPQAQDSLYTRQHYTKSDYMIPMRDGVKLFTIVYTPKDTSQKYPILMNRTPYGIPPYGPDAYRRLLGPSPEFDRDGYIVVYQDARGKFRSEGVFQVQQPYQPVKRGPQDTDESSDTYDTIEWLLKSIPNNNGRVGQWGISYPGWETVMGMIAAHPALKASSPQASPSDMFIGDDFHHNGAFRFMYVFNWLSGNARVRSGQTEERVKPFDYGTPDAYRFYLDIGTVGRVNELYFHDQVPTWNEFMQHPNYDSYWTDQNLLNSLDGIKHPILNVAGWFDQEDFYGPMSIYYTIEKKNPTNQNTLAVGPWRHGGWSSMTGDSLGLISFGSPTSLHFQREVQFPFFQYYLKDKGSYKPAEAVVFETGTNVWKTYDHWPPTAATQQTLYLNAGGKLSFTPPTDTGQVYDSYVNDPAKPVPFTQEQRPTQGYLWMVEDQRFAATRPDVLVYQTDPLTDNLTIAGPIIASMNLATSGTDADWIVKLIDVFPGNYPDPRLGDYQMLVGAEVFRAKYRNSYAKPEPMVPNKATKIEWDLRDKYHTFLKGHRMMVQVQSSWFPVIDRNPGKFMDIYHAKPEDFQKTTQRVYRSKGLPSGVRVNVMPRPTS
ncbi:MAG: CocE/NonD family hydrolase [Gemmatimonadetes bacterium]|nr:CocE/NonD family hydrolase [Gemmatimonadota bacterium]